jgi:hypothetical protein
VLSIVTAIASLFGFGAVVRLSVRALRSRSSAQPAAQGQLPAPLAG